MTFGLIGYPLSHSFSRGYFTEKFAELGLAPTHRYLNFEMPEVTELDRVLRDHPDLRGLNVTIPHKRAVLDRLDALDPAAERIGAVNTILVRDGKLTGYNTDYLGFSRDLVTKLTGTNWGADAGAVKHKMAGRRALVLGTGGAALAVREALTALGFTVLFVSRLPDAGQISYLDVSEETIADHLLVVNTTPLGMSPRVDAKPNIPYAALTPAHFCYDIVYNPAETAFMRAAAARGAGTANGLGMLHGQAEAAWEIWRK